MIKYLQKMKVTTVLIQFTLWANLLFAQENLFPTSGNVGVGVRNDAPFSGAMAPLDVRKNGSDGLVAVFGSNHSSSAVGRKLYFEFRDYQSEQYPTDARHKAVFGAISESNWGRDKGFFFSTGGEERMRIGSNGNVGIGVRYDGNFSGAMAPLDVRKNGSDGLVAVFGSNHSSSAVGRKLYFEFRDYQSEQYPTDARHKAVFGAISESNWGRDKGFFFSTGGEERMRIGSNGNVGIGTSSTGSHMLAVNGSIGARQIKVEANGWSDFVFEKEYDLRTLEEVEEHINENGHLPEIPSEAEVTENGIYLGEMNAKLLQKIEELTLYLIEQNKKIQRLEQEVSALKNE